MSPNRSPCGPPLHSWRVLRCCRYPGSQAKQYFLGIEYVFKGSDNPAYPGAWGGGCLPAQGVLTGVATMPFTCLATMCPFTCFVWGGCGPSIIAPPTSLHARLPSRWFIACLLP